RIRSFLRGLSMKKQVLVAAILASALLAPGFAEAYPKQGWYTGIAAGVGLQESTDATLAGVTNHLDFNPGFAVSGSVGYGFENQLRPEFEINYRRSSVDTATGTGAAGGTGNFSALGLMGNLFYDFDTGTGLTPYIGVGIGGAFVGADGMGSVFSGNLIDGSP